MTLILAQEEKVAIKQIDQLMETYCKGCLLKTHYRETQGKHQAHQYCISECSVGIRIKQLGNKLQ
ncbi:MULTISPECIES: zinc-finger domain-containing protein [unclassified Mammaliicoccus]|uniref:zinc-finger domain-containing protein n=1 Tax=unclassified Mammaliicoccus TaxID=2803851 RepID=UPI001EFA3082|nr:zinc-finger domain-containing protein [Mammaliicoccus fleurettii]